MIERSEMFYSGPAESGARIYQYGYYDGYHDRFKNRAPSGEETKESEDEIEECNAFTDFGDVPQRDEGYYWVKLKTKKKGRQFEVARWNGERWMRTFTRYSTASVEDKELEEIGERLQPKAEPTVEGEKNDYDPLTGRGEGAPLGEETKGEKP
jgi:hypothetical protein